MKLVPFGSLWCLVTEATAAARPPTPALPHKAIYMYPAKQEETRRESLCVFLVAAGEALHETVSELRSQDSLSSHFIVRQTMKAVVGD